MAEYAVLSANTYAIRDFQVVPIRRQDMLSIMSWRNDQIEVLRQKNLLTPAEQEKYYNDVISPSFDSPKPSQILFSFLKDNILIGYGGLVHISWEDSRAEISFLVNPERTRDEEGYQADFATFLALMKMIAYRELRLNRIFTETYDIRPTHIQVLERSGFVIEGRLRKHNIVNGKFVDSIIHGSLRDDG